MSGNYSWVRNSNTNNTSNTQNRWGNSSNTSNTSNTSKSTWGVNKPSDTEQGNAYGIGRDKWNNVQNSAGTWGKVDNSKKSNVNTTKSTTDQKTTQMGFSRTNITTTNSTGWGVLSPPVTQQSQSRGLTMGSRTSQTVDLPTSLGQPFLSNDVVFKINNKDEIFHCYHICTCERFFGISVEMLRFSDYIHAGGITYTPPKTETSNLTSNFSRTTGSTFGSTTEQKIVSKWTIPEDKIKIEPLQSNNNNNNLSQFGTLYSSNLTLSLNNEDQYIFEEDLIINSRGFSTKKSLFDTINEYHSLKTATPGLTQLMGK